MKSTKVAVSSILAAGLLVSIWVVASMTSRPAAPPPESRAPAEPRRQEARTPRDVESETPSPPDAAPEIPSDPVRPPGRRLVVRVTDEAGAPLPGATVSRRRDVVDVRFSERLVTYAKSDAAPDVSGTMNLWTGEDGLVSLPCVPVGITVELAVSDRRFGYAESSCTPSDLEEPVRLQLLPFVRLGGMVVDLGGGAVEGARVAVHRAGRHAGNRTSDDSGRFQLDRRGACSPSAHRNLQDPRGERRQEDGLSDGHRMAGSADVHMGSAIPGRLK